jgi:hypothetical protein
MTRFLMVVAAMATSCFADLQASATAMACCAKTDYTCARMGHAAPAAPAGLTDGFRLAQPAVALLSPFTIDATLSSLDSYDVVPVFKRPHDPPHLHAHILLI